MKLLILNGPNLNLLGQREPEIYGSATYHDLLALIQETAQRLGPEGRRSPVQPRGGPGGLDSGRLRRVRWYRPQPRGLHSHQHRPLGRPSGSGLPTVEVHLSDLKTREPFRQISYIRPACASYLHGAGNRGVPAGDGVSGGQNQAGTAYIAYLILICKLNCPLK